MKPLASAAVFAAFTFAAAAAEPQISPEADAVLIKAGDIFKKLTSARADVTVTIEQSLPGEKPSKSVLKQTLAAARPNKFALRLTESPEGAMGYICDGKSVWTHIEPLKQFTVDDAPATLDELLRGQGAGPESLAQLGVLHALFLADPHAAMLDGVTKLTLAGTEKIGAAECARIKGEQADMDWQAWFEQGDKPVLRKFTFSPLKGIIANAPDEMKAELKGAKIDITVECSTWDIDSPLPAPTFAFEPPKDAKKVAQFTPPDAGGGGEGAAEAMKGKPAPDFTLDLVAGGKMQLAEQKGKVVILDFWATWCGPCVAGLPVVSEVAAGFKDKGVVFFAVNQQEDAADVKKFLAAKKLDIAVPMDAKGAAAKLYNVSGIPQTVIIGKDGNIAVVHVGFAPGMKETLAKEIEALLK